MKPSFLLSSKAGMAFMVVCLSVITVATSCSKKYEPMPEPVGDAHVRYVNTVQGSQAQDFYVNGVKKSETAVAYGNASGYLTITSGINAFSLYNTGGTTANATSETYNFPIGVSGTVFYYQSPAGPLGVFAIADNMTAAPTGKAKVRFINLNKFAGANPITVSVVGETTPLIPSLVYDGLENANYLTVEPGAKFIFTMTGVTETSELDAGIAPDKIYTIWIDGTNAPATLTGHVILQN